jgi:hypothetical protein
MKAVKLSFVNRFGETIYMDKQVKDDNHLNNFINYVCRVHKYTFDEIWEL